MMEVTAHVEGHYEVLETPFARDYSWYPAYVTLLCDCGEKLTLVGISSTSSTCNRCGADHSAVIKDTQERESHRRPEVSHPWRYDTRAQKEQHLRDEAAYPVGSPWRYNDITSR